jgi:hypothetical protein
MTSTTATTILQQLGGNRFIVMTGAKNFLGGTDRLMFALPARAAKGGINKVVVKLTPADTYDVEFYRLTRGGLNCELIASHTEVYADALRAIFTSETGLLVSL